jgi:hypothetical protein
MEYNLLDAFPNSKMVNLVPRLFPLLLRGAGIKTLGTRLQNGFCSVASSRPFINGQIFRQYAQITTPVSKENTALVILLFQTY